MSRDAAYAGSKPALILACSIVLGFLFDYLVFGHLVGIGFTFFIASVIAGYLLLSSYARHSVPRDLYWLLPLALFFAAMPAFRANELLMVLNGLATLGTLLLALEVSSRGKVETMALFDFLALLIPFKLVDPLITTISAAISGVSAGRDTARSRQIVRGIAITVPVLVVFVILFSSADAIFNSYITRFLDFDIEPETFVRIALSTVTALVACAAYAYALARSEPSTGRYSVSGKAGLIETGILLGSVNALFLIFIVIQAQYLFGGERNVLEAGMTYAEYGRRGFFELIGIAALSFLILVAVEKLIERSAERHTSAFRFLGTLLVVQVGVIMISAFVRLALYEDAYGFTTLRLYSHAFIIFLAFFYASLLYKILQNGSEEAFALRTFLTIAVFVGAMSLFNPDAFIAQKNLARYTATGKLDSEYMRTLSADASHVLVQLLDAPDEEHRRNIGERLARRLQIEQRPWQGWNYAREQERVLLEANANKLVPFSQLSSVSEL